MAEKNVKAAVASMRENRMYSFAKEPWTTEGIVRRTMERESSLLRYENLGKGGLLVGDLLAAVPGSSNVASVEKGVVDDP